MNIGFIGTGSMGNPIACNLLDAGHRLFVNDINEKSAGNLLSKGATWCECPAEIAKESQVIFLSLPSHIEVAAVCFDQNGIFSSIQKNAFLIDLTTISISLIPKLQASEKEHQFHYLSSPVSQGVDNAKIGLLSIFVGGKEKDYIQCLPLYRIIAKEIIYTGSHLSAISAKLLTNLLWFINAASIGEALVIGAKSDIDLPTLQKVIINSCGNSWVAEHDIPSIYNGDYDKSFTTKLCCKDLRLINELAASINIPIEIGALVEQIFIRARNIYGDNSPELSVVKQIEEITNTTLTLNRNPES
uniref:3-hydroxyisobutyrate dehydrogenase n=1 Tax=Candidatus Kentrum eta TaxID=2126337 RepID=A0A450VDY4_9GAMM|nr:MAG: 3-hydroxyisobutyrate dehydrogenase [Candidatus Kentron sp. H]VFK03299.1 MAG: 3-hydroxyisobutyrate dehydrogenase [Candidatus Kentron sp. H]VFK05937.1 MAG: 3-hydroxyisobutyrate dehydrogenase [Candidatus Kentron sp. H]